MPDPPDESLQAAIAELWRDARPRARERVQLLEDAVAALGRGELDTEGGAAATREAHKLAGSLGTFGMPDGTTQARAIERALAAGATPADAPALSERVAALWTTVQDGGPA